MITYQALLQALWHLGNDDDRAAIHATGQGWLTSRQEAAEIVRVAIAALALTNRKDT